MKLAITKTPSSTRLVESDVITAAISDLLSLYGPKMNTLTVKRLIIGVFFVGIQLSDGSTGIAYTPPEAISRGSCQLLRQGWRACRGLPVARILKRELAGPFAEVICLATLNALSAPLFSSGRYLTTNCDLAGIPSLFANRRVCVVGAIIPLLRKMKELRCASVSIIDKKEETREEAEAEYGTFLRPDRLSEALAACQTAVFTGASIANGSFEELLHHTPEDAAIAVVGPSAGFIPDPLFARRVAVVATSRVNDGDLALEILGEGGGAYQLFHSCMEKISLLNSARFRELRLEIYSS